MRLQILQEDIDKGIPREPESCPIALAMSRELGETCRVGNMFVNTVDYLSYYLLDIPAKRFIEAYDLAEPVEPLEVELRGPYRVEELEFYQTMKRDTRHG